MANCLFVDFSSIDTTMISDKVAMTQRYTAKQGTQLVKSQWSEKESGWSCLAGSLTNVSATDRTRGTKCHSPINTKQAGSATWKPAIWTRKDQTQWRLENGELQGSG